MLNPVFWGVAGVVITGYVARMIGTSEYGKLSFALAFINLFTLFTNLGFNNYMMKEFASDVDSAEILFVPTLIIRGLLAVITYMLGILFINIFEYPESTKAVYYAAGLIVLPNYLTDSAEGVFKGQESMQFIAKLHFVNNLLTNLFRCLLVYLGYKALGLAWNRVVVNSLTMLLAGYFTYKHFLRFKVTFQWALYKKIILGTLPFAFSTSFLIIYNRLDIIMLSYFISDESVAFYRAAFVLTEKLTIFTVAFVGAIYPAIARLVSQDKEKAIALYNRGFFYLYFISVPMAVGGFLLSDQIILLVFGKGYMEAAMVLKVLFLAVPFSYTTNIMGNVLMASGQATLFTYTMTVLCVTNVVANAILIPRYAHTGAAFATLLAQVLVFLFLVYLTTKKFGKLSISLRYAKVIAAAGGMAAALLLLRGQNIFVLITTGVVVYCLLVLILMIFPRDEIVEIKNMVLRRKTP